MTLHIFIHSRLKRAEAVALLDSGATENFISINYMKKLGLPIWRLTYERRLFNVVTTGPSATLGAVVKQVGEENVHKACAAAAKPPVPWQTPRLMIVYALGL